MDPVTIAIIGSALLNWWAGKKSAQASKDAAQTQASSVQQGIDVTQQAQQQSQDFMQQMWNQQQQNAAPYVAMGHNALGSLANLTGLPALPGVGDPSKGGYKTVGGGRAMDQYGTPPRPGMAGTSSLGSMGIPQNGGYNAPSMVMMIAPDGSQRQVPQTMVPHYQQKGARVVG